MLPADIIRTRQNQKSQLAAELNRQIAWLRNAHEVAKGGQVFPASRWRVAADVLANGQDFKLAAYADHVASGEAALQRKLFPEAIAAFRRALDTGLDRGYAS